MGVSFVCVCEVVLSNRKPIGIMDDVGRTGKLAPGSLIGSPVYCSICYPSVKGDFFAFGCVLSLKVAVQLRVSSLTL